ncbi:hypothetical protein GCM10010532_025520 [Dactylosporangium siamense]|uniref:Uncharacterized protein n=1 Tax=Dactylosporangium siamense TaxID=685454 RepID=A0A919PUI1_9ACTN|nr:hypothetical protein Dsi01nite_091160 [Dactylosporangium siamense]
MLHAPTLGDRATVIERRERIPLRAEAGCTEKPGFCGIATFDWHHAV